MISSNRNARKSFEALQKTSEADLFLRLNDTIYRSDEGKKIIECTRTGKPVLETNGGKVTERELENFLNEVETVWLLIEQGSLSSKIAKVGFSWVIERLKESQEIMKYIEKAQEKYGAVAWKTITDYDPDLHLGQPK